MTSENVANWLWRTASFVCAFVAAAIWLGQVAIDRRIQSGETIGEIVFSPGGSMVAVTNENAHTVNAWNTKTTAPLGRFEVAHAVPSFLAFSPDSNRLAATSHGFTELARLFPARIDIFRPSTSMKPERTIYLKDAAIADIGFVDDATVAVVLRHSIGTYDISTGRQ
ncbi:MAG TPA: WD40 repeat domain-containing protein, partial [Pirellulales bacterium]|nr:WD40 repeat domain-containing protein [Pirellulales bacterium]